jgi:RNA polymerase sigma factor (sigma-70 family)
MPLTLPSERRSDDDRRFIAFARAHGPALLAFARALCHDEHDAQDLVQDALTRVYRRWHRVRDDEALFYVRRSIANRRIDLWRRSGRAERMPVSDVATGSGGGLDEVEARARAVALLRTLPREQRAVLAMRLLFDLPDDIIARSLGIRPATVRSRARRGLSALRIQLDSEYTLTSSPS